jgi:hypothetical protein
VRRSDVEHPGDFGGGSDPVSGHILESLSRRPPGISVVTEKPSTADAPAKAERSRRPSQSVLRSHCWRGSTSASAIM